jgi:hypothetical protein
MKVNVWEAVIYSDTDYVYRDFCVSLSSPKYILH